MKYTSGYHGMIWEMKLSDELGYAYVKTIEPNRIIDKRHVGFLGQILNYRSDKPMQTLDTQLIRQIEPLGVAHLLVGNVPGKGEDRWKALGYYLTGQEEVPLFKGLADPGDEIENSLWHLISGSAAVDILPDLYSYSQVKHLNFFKHLNCCYFKYRIVLEWMKELSMNYDSYESKNVGSTFIEEQKRQTRYTVPLTDIPKEYWGKAMP